MWLAHCVHLSDEAVARLGATGTGVAHCPSSNGRLGAGIAPVRTLLDAGAPVGLGVDGSSSNESGRMVGELHQALLAARYAGGPQALTARDCLRMATMGGARCLGRADELGSLEPGKLADLAVWRVDGLPGAGIEDPVCTLVFGAPALEHLFVGGQPGGDRRRAEHGRRRRAGRRGGQGERGHRRARNSIILLTPVPGRARSWSSSVRTGTGRRRSGCCGWPAARRAGGGDLIRDWNVSTSLSGDLAATHLTGDNSDVLTTDTQKNTVYAFASRLGAVEPEVLGLDAGRALRFQPAADHPGPGDGRGVRLGRRSARPRTRSPATATLTRAARVVHDAALGPAWWPGSTD